MLPKYSDNYGDELTSGDWAHAASRMKDTQLSESGYWAFVAREIEQFNKEVRQRAEHQRRDV